MKFRPDRTFFDQAARFDLRYTCEHCAFFDPKAGECIHGYPNEVHRLGYYNASPPWVIPCKDFEYL